MRNEEDGSDGVATRKPSTKNRRKGLALIDHSCSELDEVLTDEQMLVVRELGKYYHRMFTDAIKEFQYYVGSDKIPATRPDLVYNNMHAMIYAPADLNVLKRRANEQGKELRDILHLVEHEFLRVVEMTVPGVLRKGMSDKWTRAAIKQAVRDHAFKTADLFRTVDDGSNFFKIQKKGRTK